jgi:hypothetical protein
VDASAQEALRGGQRADFVGQHVHQLGLGIRTAVGQDALEVVPDAFIGIQFGSIRGERHQVEAARAGKQILDSIGTMDLRIVQKNNQMTADLPEEMAQESLDLFALDVVLIQQAIERTMQALGADGNTGDRGDSVVAVAVTHHRGLPHRAPCFPYGGNQEEPGFVDEDDVGCQPCGVFFTAGHTVDFH